MTNLTVLIAQYYVNHCFSSLPYHQAFVAAETYIRSLYDAGDLDEESFNVIRSSYPSLREAQCTCPEDNLTYAETLCYEVLQDIFIGHSSNEAKDLCFKLLYIYRSTGLISSSAYRRLSQFVCGVSHDISSFEQI